MCFPYEVEKVSEAGAYFDSKVLPGLWSATTKLTGKLKVSLGRRLSAGAFEKRYLQWLCEEQRFLKVRGIRIRSPVPMEWEQIYVSLMLNRPSRERPNARRGVDEVSREESLEDLRPEPSRSPDMRAVAPQRLSIGEVLQRCPDRLVILGGPGTGKTTLLSYLALKFARGQAREALGLEEQRLPIFIPLRDQ